MRRARGFTLIELMIAVGIVGLLTALAVPTWATVAAKARQAEARSGLLAIETLETAFFGEHHQYGTLVEIGFVLEGAGRYGFLISEDEGGFVGVNSSGWDFGGGDRRGRDTPPENSTNTPGNLGPETTRSTPPGNPHVDTDSYEVIAFGKISNAPPPRDIDVWSIDHKGWLQNIAPGY